MAWQVARLTYVGKRIAHTHKLELTHTHTHTFSLSLSFSHAAARTGIFFTLTLTFSSLPLSQLAQVFKLKFVGASDDATTLPSSPPVPH